MPQTDDTTNPPDFGILISSVRIPLRAWLNQCAVVTLVSIVICVVLFISRGMLLDQDSPWRLPRNNSLALVAYGTVAVLVSAGLLVPGVTMIRRLARLRHAQLAIYWHGIVLTGGVIKLHRRRFDRSKVIAAGIVTCEALPRNLPRFGGLVFLRQRVVIWIDIRSADGTIARVRLDREFLPTELLLMSSVVTDLARRWEIPLIQSREVLWSRQGLDSI